MTSENEINTLAISLMLRYWWIIPILVFTPLLKLLRPKIKGRVGEATVNLAAKFRLDPKIYRLIKDVTLPTKQGTTQIDHVVISKFGVFAIETKNYKGWIFADTKSPKWTQMNFKQKHRFQNPLRQNYGHICALTDLLEISKDKIHGVVCFMGNATFKTEVPKGVFIQGRYVNYIKSFRTEVFTEKEVGALVERIETSRLKRGFKTNRNHVRHVQAHQNPSPSIGKTCPRCGAEMIMRTAKRGIHAGNNFWGCSRYPACRSTQPTDA